MEKLKVTHDHSLTDILKVLIFTLVLLIPGFMFLPSMLYFGYNEQANAPTKEIQETEQMLVDFNQQIQNGNFNNTQNWNAARGDIQAIDNVCNYKYTEVVTGIGNRIQQNVNTTANETYIINMEVYSPHDTFLLINFAVPNAYNLQNTNIVANTWTRVQYIFTPNVNNTYLYIALSGNNEFQVNDVAYYKNIYMCNLTSMFSYENIPSLTQWNSWFTNDYYQTTQSQEIIVEKPIGTETVVDITTQLEYNWEQIWQKPLLAWTNTSILKNGLDNFTQAFGITNTSYLNNLITYELIMVGVYIVIDIVLELFKWLTHMIGNK